MDGHPRRNPCVFSLVFSLVGRTAGARLLARAQPAWIGLTLTAAVLFGPHALHPADIAREARESIALRVALWGTWLLLTIPATNAALRDRRTDLLRGLPSGRLRTFLATLGWILIGQVPFAAFWAAASGIVAGHRALLLSAALAVSIGAPGRSAIRALAIAGGAIAVALDASAVATLALVPLFMIATYQAWAHAPDRPTVSGFSVRGPAVIAIAMAHGLRLLRVERAAVLRGLTLSLVGGLVAALAVRNNGYAGGASARSVFLTAAGVAAVLASAAVAAPLRESDASIDALLRSNGASDRLRALARAITAALCGCFFSVCGLVVARTIVVLPLSLAASAPLLGAVVSALVVEREVRRTTRNRRRRGDNSGRAVVELGSLAIVVALLASWIADAAVAAVGAAGLAAWWWGARRRGVSRVGPMRSSAALSLVRVAKHFAGHAVLQGVTLDVARGSIAWLRGENGSGKSTLLRIAAGILEPDGGVVVVAGRRLDLERDAALRVLGYAADTSDLPDHLSVREFLGLVAALRGADAAGNAPSLLGVGSLLAERLSSLSLGQRRRAAIAAAMVGDPCVLLLDEPTNGLDHDGLADLEALLEAHRRRGGTALLASHEASFAARVCDARLSMVAGATAPA